MFSRRALRTCHFTLRSRAFQTLSIHYSLPSRSSPQLLIKRSLSGFPGQSRVPADDQLFKKVRSIRRLRTAVWALAFFTSLSWLLTAIVMREAREPTKEPDMVQKPQYATVSVMQTALEELRADLARSTLTSTHRDLTEMICTDPDILQDHSHSTWSTSNCSTQPVAVIYPESTEDVCIITKICSKHRIPIVPYGAGSSVEGNFSAPHSGWTINFSRMDKIVAFNNEDMDVVVQPGVNWVKLNEQIAASGLFLPLDPSPTAYIGGMIATNCSGTNAMRYGTMKDYTLNVTVVLADGTVVKTRKRARKSSAGYDLTKLIVGSEGTLGIVTEATLKLAVIPKETGVATCTFSDVKSAANAAVAMMREGITGLAALEIMDEASMRVINKNGGTLKADGNSRRLWSEKPTLFLKLSGTGQSINNDAKAVKDIMQNYGGSQFEVAQSGAEKDAIWAARKEALWAMLAQRDPGTEIWSTDVAVPLSRLAEIIDVSKKDSSKLGLFNTVLGHVGDGNFHQSVMYHPDDEREKKAVKACVENMMSRALAMEGTVSGEHAIGIGKKESLAKEVGENTLEMMRRIKMAVDPLWIMNPGKVFDQKSMVERNPFTLTSTASPSESI